MIAPPPERAFRRAQWKVLLATMFCYLFFYTGRQSFGFAIPGIVEELGISKTTLGLASAIMLWAYAAGQAVNGNLGDIFGGRRMMSLGAILSCGLNWITSFGTTFAALAVPWGLNGYAQSMAWAPGSRVLSNWWGHEERGRVYGFYVFAAGSSSVLAFVFPLLVLQFGLDWRWIFRLPVLLLLVGGVAYYVLVRDRPEEAGFPPLADDDKTDETLGARESRDEAIIGQTAEQNTFAAASLRASETSWDRYRYALADGRFLCACCAIGFQSLARYGLLFWVPVHFLGKNWKDPSSNDMWIAVALPVGMALGAVANGWISDRLFAANRSRSICLFMLFAAVCSFGMYYLPRGSVLAVPLLFWTGFFAYGPQSAFWALCPDLLGRARAGTGTGVMNTFAYLFAGLGEPLIGWTIESYHNTGAVFAIVAASCLISAALAPLIRR